MTALTRVWVEASLAQNMTNILNFITFDLAFLVQVMFSLLGQYLLEDSVMLFFSLSPDKNIID